jgi:hypothetical protein
MENLDLKLTSKINNVFAIPQDKNTILFMQDKGTNEILKLCENGDIFVQGRLAENDKEVVDALKEFLKSHRFLK